MDRDTQVELLQELVDLHASKSPYLDETWETAAIENYTDSARFEREQERIIRSLPQIAAHASQLPEAGSFLRIEVGGRPLLLVRDETGAARGFYNVCRHRGAQLVGEQSGCAKRFTCPYHAWTFSTQGNLIAVPHEKTGFPDLDREKLGLRAVACEEYGGFVWVDLAGAGEIDVAAHLGELAGEFLQIDAGSHVIYDTTRRDIAANWKILVEGGVEAYHFRIAHRDTIAPLFLENLSSYRCFGRHMRSVLPRSTLPELSGSAEDEWDIRKHSNLLYSLFPGSQFLVQEDHVVWIQSFPLSVDRTLLKLSTLIPASDNTAEKGDYWRRNHDLTMVTLDEDFELGEGIQRGLASGANQHLNFGRFEGALAKFNSCVDEIIS